MRQGEGERGDPTVVLVLRLPNVGKLEKIHWAVRQGSGKGLKLRNKLTCFWSSFVRLIIRSSFGWSLLACWICSACFSRINAASWAYFSIWFRFCVISSVNLSKYLQWILADTCNRKKKRRAKVKRTRYNKIYIRYNKKLPFRANDLIELFLVGIGDGGKDPFALGQHFLQLHHWQVDLRVREKDKIHTTVAFRFENSHTQKCLQLKKIGKLSFSTKSPTH